MILLRSLVVAVVLIGLVARGGAEVAPSSMFGDHMVLQRGMPVPIWGKAEPGETVTVTFAGQAVSATAGADGRWRADLPALDASAEGRTLAIQGKTSTISFEDVLVGEVWVCAGQSNMQYGWGMESHPMFNWGGDAKLAALVPDARQRPIRNYHVPVNVSFSPEENSKGAWSTDVSGSAIAFGFSYYLQKALDVPVAVIVTCWGSSSIEGWMPRELTEELPHFKAIMTAFDASSNTQSRVQAAIDRGVRPGNVFIRKQPNLLYNAMLHPVIPYASRGLVWYQGEANADQPEQYAQSLPVWIRRLRTEWGRDDFFVLGVMLPGFGEDDGRPDAKSWAWFRESQMKGLELPHAAVVNTVDLGDAKNIHPSDKDPIARRLSFLARASVYHEKVNGKGPVYRGAAVNGNQMTITFEHAEGLKTLDGGAPKGFWLADAQGVWYPAKAMIAGTMVILQADGVESLKACRYAWSGKPDVNLVNESNLPAYPFRTDD